MTTELSLKINVKKKEKKRIPCRTSRDSDDKKTPPNNFDLVLGDLDI